MVLLGQPLAPIWNKFQTAGLSAVTHLLEKLPACSAHGRYQTAV